MSIFTKQKSQRAFTLIELCIVVVVVALIVAGVVTGQSLVQQAKIRALLSEVEQIKSATNSFFLQYSAIPGDFNQA